MNILNFVKRSLKVQLILILGIIFIIMVLLNSIYYPHQERELGLKIAKSHVETFTEMLALSLASGLAEGNHEFVTKTFNWAQHSARAAQETTTLIEETVARVENETKIAHSTAKSLDSWRLAENSTCEKSVIQAGTC